MAAGCSRGSQRDEIAYEIWNPIFTDSFRDLLSATHIMTPLMDMKLLSATGTNLVSRPHTSGMCTAGQTKWQLMIRESPQRLERTLVTLLQEIFQETVNL